MLLAVIDAWHQAGKRFDPSALNCRNCMRGGGIESSRFLTEEELSKLRAAVQEGGKV